MVDSAALGAAVRALSREVESLRGRRFTGPVAYRVLSTEAIAAHFREDGARSSAEQRADDALAVALGLIADEDVHESEAYARMMGAEAQGFYDPRDAVLTLSESEASGLTRTGPAGVEARATVVHELVHALQHQHFRARVEVDDAAPAMIDRAGVRLALLEGDATLVTLEWQARQRGARLLGTPELRPRIERWAERAQVLTEADLPKYLLDAMEQPYQAGAFAVGALYERGGWAAVDEALARDSLRTGALLHPERGDAGLVTVTASSVRPERTVRVAERELGELELRLFLSSVLRKERAAELAAHWRGDAIALDRVEDRAGSPMVVQWRIACDGPEGAAALRDDLRALLERWTREGCPRMRGGAVGLCPASITVEGSELWVRRGR
jgi:hypothetical protein